MTTVISRPASTPRIGTRPKVARKLATSRHVAQLGHRIAHHIQADKENAETGDDAADLANHQLFAEGIHQYADQQERRSDIRKLEGDQLGGDGGADVCAENDACRLINIHQPRVDEADDHDGRGRGGLHQHRKEHTYKQSEQAVAGQHLQQMSQTVTSGALQLVAHHFHAEQEQTQSAAQHEEILPRHLILSL